MRLGELYAIGILGNSSDTTPPLSGDLFVSDAVLYTESGEIIWSGPLNLTRNEAKLRDIYLALNEHIYLVSAGDLRTGTDLLSISMWSTNPLKGDPPGTSRNHHLQLVDNSTSTYTQLKNSFEKIAEIPVDRILDLGNEDVSPLDRLQLFIMDLCEDSTLYVSKEFFLALLKRSVEWIRRRKDHEGISDEELMQTISDVVYGDPAKAMLPFAESYSWATFGGIWRHARSCSAEAEEEQDVFAHFQYPHAS